MSARLRWLAASALCLAVGVLAPAAAQAAAPAWSLVLTPMPTNFTPGGGDEYFAVATNVGGAPTTATPAVLKVTLPAGFLPTGFQALNSDKSATAGPICSIASQTVTCTNTDIVHPGRRLLVKIRVDVTAPEGTQDATASISGGGAAAEITATMPTPVQPQPVPFEFLPGFAAPLNNAEGAPVALAGSHPYQQTISFGFPTKNPGDGLTNDGHPRNITVELPQGMIGDPAASQVLCTEAELTSEEGCPDASQVGVSDVTTLLLAGEATVFTNAIYNMVPPPGTPAEFGIDVADVGIFAHITTAVRSDGDYGVEASVNDVLAFGRQPIFNISAQLWGDPSSAAHDSIRGNCSGLNGTCPVTPAKTAFLTMPGNCPGRPLPFEVLADSWEEPAPEFAPQRTFYESADLTGVTPVSVEDCEGLEFEPSIEARPTTNHADSPTGLDFQLHQPQEEPHLEPLSGRATGILKDATVTFPAGLAVNPSQAAGLEACDEVQIGFEGEKEGALHFSRSPQSCPSAAKIGTVEVASPLLAQRNAGHEVQIDPEGGRPLPEPLHGSLYLAKPFANPFGSFVAVYLVVEDPKTGITAKLAGEGQLDSASGQITTRFRESPELPIEDIGVHLFGGDRGTLVTPPACGSYATHSSLTPWSAASEGEAATPTDSFKVTQAAAGGPCPATAPNAPALSAGTLEPSAGKYSPLLFKLSRPDGSQRLAKIEATLPPGLSAKLAGVAQCPEADIAKAISREHPNDGAAEIADPSCPAASEVGSVDVGAGAGPTPFHTTGHAYLAGPYKGAPLSFVIITPAVAGPFDLGAVVVRSAVYLNPETAQPRTVSDPLPQIIDGVPVDVRSVALRLDRPTFTINPTSCDEEQFSGAVTSALGEVAPLSERFQVGGCKSLPFKPKLGVRLFGPIHRGGHPRLKATFTAKPGEANTARISFAFPPSEFIDQAHFRTICTRVQYAANQCPAGSIYGHARATTPLVDYPLEGPIYLRSSTHKLPDVVLALRGPASQPIALDVAGRVDSVNGGLRVRFETVPDAPLSKGVVEMQGGKKGLFQNSTNICKGTHRARLKLDAQSGKVSDSQPKLVAQCKKPKGKSGKK